MQDKQPKIVHKLLVRTFILLLAVAAVFVGIQWVLKWRKDPDSGTADTNQMIAAIQIHEEGQQAVLFDASGNKTPSPEYQPGKTDRDLAWRPDGNRLFFVSDRKQDSFQIYRWNPARGAVDQRSTGTLSKFDPSFPIVDLSESAALASAGQKVLITQGGFVLEYDLKESTSQQLLPPPSGVTVGAEEGAGGSGQLDALYKRYGNAFRVARWIKNGAYIAAIMKGDEQETLIIQQMTAATGTPEEQMLQLAPRAVMGGDRIDMDVDPKTGNLVFTVLNFQFPDRDNIPERNIKNGRVVKDFVNGIFIYDPSKPTEEALLPIAISNDPKNAFGPAVCGPDGSKVMVTTGSYDGATYTPAGLAILPNTPGGIQSGTPLIGGAIYEASWHPAGTSVTYIKREGGKRSIYKINVDGSGETKVSDDGNYMTPFFSPQSK